jgi:hypothetical protein
VEEGLHVGPEGFVVAVDAGPGGWWASPSWGADSGEQGCDDFVANGEQGSNGAGGVGRQVVAAGPAGFGDEFLSAELAQVVGDLAGGVFV